MKTKRDTQIIDPIFANHQVSVVLARSDPEQINHGRVYLVPGILDKLIDPSKSELSTIHDDLDVRGIMIGEINSDFEYQQLYLGTVERFRSQGINAVELMIPNHDKIKAPVISHLRSAHSAIVKPRITISPMIDVSGPCSQKCRIEIWIVPGDMSDHDDFGEHDGLYIEDYFELRGVLAAVCIGSEEEQLLVNKVTRLFEAQGFEVFIEGTIND